MSPVLDVKTLLIISDIRYHYSFAPQTNNLKWLSFSPFVIILAPLSPQGSSQLLSSVSSSPPALFPLSSFLFVSSACLWRCPQWPFIFSITWLWYWKLMTQALYGQIWATHSPSGQDFVTADSVGLLADAASSAPHMLPLLWPPLFHSIWVIHTWLVVACGLQRAPEHHPTQQVELAPNLQPQPTSR